MTYSETRPDNPKLILPASFAYYVGKIEAAMLQQICTWFDVTKEKSCFQGKYWVNKSEDDFDIMFKTVPSYLVQLSLINLTRLGYIDVKTDCQFYDETVRWYSLNYDVLFQALAEQKKHIVLHSQDQKI